MFEEQLRKDIAKVILTGGAIERGVARNRVDFDFPDSHTVYWKVHKGTPTRTEYWQDAGAETKNETTFFNAYVADGATGLMRLIKSILKPITVREPQSDDIPF